jgi:undecaprenyl-diphosphatase
MTLPEIDTLIFIFINRDIQNSLFDFLMPLITRKAYFFFLPLFLWVLVRDRKKALLLLILGFASLLIADWAGNTLKHLCERTRPCHVLDEVRLLVGCGRAFSFPSNHAANAFAFAVPFLVMVKQRIRYSFLIVAVVAAFSRIYVGVHYPSDVIAGAMTGSLAAISLISLFRWSSRRYEQKPHSTILFLSLLALSLFRIYYIQHGPLELSPDEAHYWEWSRRLDLSYYSKGPMIAYLIYLGTSVFGDTVFGIRIMAVVFSLLSSVVLYKTGKELYGETTGVASAILLQMIPLFSTYGVVFTIDSPFIFFWILSLFLFSRAVCSTHKGSPPRSLHMPGEEMPGQGGTLHTQEDAAGVSSRVWILLGISVGMGMLTKYTMAFFYPCAFLCLLLTPERRYLLLTKGPYAAFFVSIVLFIPVIFWNAQHEWVTFRHTAGQAHLGEGFRVSPLTFIEFVGSQLGVLTPLLCVFMLHALWKLRTLIRGSFLFWFSFPVLLFFALKSIHAKVQANWAMTGYITGVIAFCALYAGSWYTLRRGKKTGVVAAVVLALFVTGISHYPSVLNLPPGLDPTVRLQGWESLGKEVSRLAEKMKETAPVFIFSDKYQVSSQLAFYGEGHPVTYCIELSRRMNQYDIWPGFNDLVHYNAVFVRTGDVRASKKVYRSFQKVEKRLFHAYTKHRREIKEYSIFLCYDFKGMKKENPESY